MTIYLHCFFGHVFGACDNLAWVLVHEKGVTKPDGSELPPTWIGLRKGNKLVRAGLSADMIGVLDRLKMQVASNRRRTLVTHTFEEMNHVKYR